MTKIDKFLLYLENPEVQNKIISIVLNSDELSVLKGCNTYNDDNQYIMQENEIADLKSRIAELQKLYNEVLANKQEQDETIIDLKNQLSKSDLRCKEMNASISLLEEQRETLLLEKRDLNNRIDDLERTLSESHIDNKRLSMQIDTIDKKNKEYEKAFKDPCQLYVAYQKTSDYTKDGLANVISISDVGSFMISCSNSENLKSIWEYTKYLIANDGTSEDIQILCSLFDYFFDLYNTSLPEPVYRRDEVMVGDDYDDAEHTRSRFSAASGEITEIVLRGYQVINTGYIVCKSVVKV